MRRTLFNANTDRMTYGIREMVELAARVGALDPNFGFIGENIGDPVAKGWDAPGFVKRIVADLVRARDNKVFGYTHSYGRIETRRWVADYARRYSPSSRLDGDHVVFTNGLGSAISIFYRTLKKGTRIIQPSPAYPAHYSTECFAAGAASISYRLDPDKGWSPDLAHLERQIRRYPQIAGILVINPNNPTGAVYDAPTLEAIIRLAERYKLMLISDEVYFRMVYNNCRYIHMTELVGRRVPLVVMRGISKDVPWPGARCGWMEFHNTDLDADFASFFESIKKTLMMEVCSTTLPQMALPLIYDHPEFNRWNARYTKELERNGNAIAGILRQTPGLRVPPIQGAFYMMALFNPKVLNARQTLPIACAAVRAFIRKAVAKPNLPLDKRFAYYLLASTGICVVPATDFASSNPGFRITTLDRNPSRRDRVYRTLSASIQRYLAS
ncbi:MAG: pyridoxal phosphate-dependent aminotransferase [Verrucomicrobia bacterium]|nr:pyridoxal phosphate-dependent aminotransferase [Verrucomicrobiota bacterium]MBU1735311.1 pyridoxal phosphate-dependent aminotransferase [Verrucomicrobiota bacterium]MBU1858164.1 pyridoxal phosphate-dependent aminotransferase [Verrucomicrobiota bacterium]